MGRSDRVWHCQQNDGLKVLKMATTKWQENVVILGLGSDHLSRAIYDLDMTLHSGAQKQPIIMHKITLTCESKAAFLERLHVLAK